MQQQPRIGRDESASTLCIPLCRFRAWAIFDSELEAYPARLDAFQQERPDRIRSSAQDQQALQAPHEVVGRVALVKLLVESLEILCGQPVVGTLDFWLLSGHKSMIHPRPVGCKKFLAGLLG
jgi:hypothetical protein